MTHERLVMRTAVIGLLSLLAVGSPVASAADGSLVLARKVVELLEVREVYESYRLACMSEAPGSMFDPRAIIQRDPDAFGGVSPQSSYWPEIQAAFKRFQELSCSRVSPEELADFYAEQYAKHSSPEDLQAAIDFYLSESGKRFLRANRDVNVELNKYSLELTQAAARELFPKHHAEVRAIAERYRVAPR